MNSIIRLLLLLSPMAHAQPSVPAAPEPVPAAAKASLSALTLSSAIDRALDNNPGLKEKRQRAEAAGASVGSARASLFPTVSAFASADHKKDAVFGVGSPKFNGEPYNQYSVGLDAKQPLLAWGVFSGISAASADRDLSAMDLEMAERDLSVEVIQIFYTVLLKHRTLNSLKNVEQIEKEALVTAQKRSRIGRGQLLDVLQVKTQLALLTPKIEAAQVQWKLAAVKLAILMGDLSVEELRVVGSLEPPAIYARRLDAIESDKKAKLEDLPEFRRAVLAEEQARDQKSALLGKHWPSLSATGNIARNAYAKRDLFESATTSWAVGLELSIPLFSGLTSVYERNALSARVIELENARDSVRNQLIAAQVEALKNLELSEQTVKSAREAFDLAKAAMNEARRNYQFSTIDFLQFLTVQQDFFEAESSLNQAKYDYILAAARYYVATGLSLDGLVSKLNEEKSS